MFLIRDSVLAHYRDNIDTFIVGDLRAGEQELEDLEQLIELYKNDLINHVKVRLEDAVCYNHEIFRGMHKLPTCLMAEILHSKILCKVENIFQGIHYEIVFKDLQYKYQNGVTPGDARPSRFQMFEPRSNKYAEQNQGPNRRVSLKEMGSKKIEEIGSKIKSFINLG